MFKRIWLLLSFSVITISSHALSVQEVWDEIIKNDIKHPEVVLRQAIWESGWFKCKNCGYSINNNLFGFQNGKKYYDSWQESVADYKKWQDKNYKCQDSCTDATYYDFIVKIGYAENGTKYIKALKSLKLPELK